MLFELILFHSISTLLLEVLQLIFRRSRNCWRQNLCHPNNFQAYHLIYLTIEHFFHEKCFRPNLSDSPLVCLISYPPILRGHGTCHELAFVKRSRASDMTYDFFFFFITFRQFWNKLFPILCSCVFRNSDSNWRFRKLNNTFSDAIWNNQTFFSIQILRSFDITALIF